MSIVLARIDQRLVHGITVNQWNRLLKPKRFMVVDDDISQNETAKAGMRMSKPVGTGMSIINKQKAIDNFNNGNYDNQKVFLIVKEPSVLLDLLANGIKIPAVNVGMIFHTDGRTPVTDRVALNSKELKDLQEIKKIGIPVTFQYTPTDNAIEIENVIKGKNI